MKKSFTAKLWKAMRISLVQSIIGMVFCGITMAHDNFGQLLNEKITINLPDGNLEMALHTIETQAGIHFNFNNDQIDLSQPISIVASGKLLKEILRQLFLPLNISYKVQEQDRIITLRKDLAIPASDAASTPAFDTKEKITGRVTDVVSKQPVAGVYVIIKNTATGTTTDADGNFAIEAEKNDVLVFSFIGYTQVETAVTNRSVIDVELSEDLKTFKEVIINAGYYEVKEKEQTGNISKITSAQIATQPVSNPLQALQGRMPGVYLQQETGVPGSNIIVRIRGQNSLTSGNEPLYIIDNVPFMPANLSSTPVSGTIIGRAGISPLNSINPADIESIEVLKDADATAIYGSRGANGVILITTKKGKATASGKPRFDFNFYSGASKVTSQMNLMNTSQYVAMRKEAFRQDQVEPDAFNAVDLTVWDTTRNTNWQKVLIGGTAKTTNLQASLSGGNALIQYSFNTGYERQGTVFPGNLYAEKISTRLSLVHTSADKKFKAMISTLYSINRSKLLTTDYTQSALILAPNAPALHNPDGSLNWENGTWQNPLSELELKYKNKTDNLIANANFSYQLIKGLELSASLGFNTMNMGDKILRPSTYYNPIYNSTSKDASLVQNNGSSQSWIIEPKISYTKQIGNGVLSVLSGATFQQKADERLEQYADNFSSDALIEDLSAAVNTYPGDYFSNVYRYDAIYGRINYNLSGKYIVNATGRRDGSSRFGPGNRFANFGAIGAAWIFSKENFLVNSTVLSFGKVRMSYGTTGNDQIGDYQYLSTYSSNGNSYQNIMGIIPTRLYNPDFAWEVNKKIEAGLELGFFEDRATVSASFYRNRSSNQLISYPLALTTGFSGVQANLGATVQNQGWEGVVQSTIIKKQNFTWSSSMNLTIPSNKLISFPLLERSTYANRYVIGEPITIIKRYHYIGMDQQNGNYLVEDFNGDGIISSLDRQQVTDIGLKYYGGWNNTFSLHGFELDIFFQFVKQTGRNYWGTMFPIVGLPINIPDKVIQDHWVSSADAGKSFQRYSAGFNDEMAQSAFNFNESDAIISDASFIRLKNISLSYILPSRWTTDKIKCRIYAQGQNLLTITNYFGLDPENFNTSSLPMLRTVAWGAQLTF